MKTETKAKRAKAPATRTKAHSCKGGTPAQNREEIVQVIFEGMARGDSVRKMCEEVNLPISTFFRWLSESESLTEQYTRARESRADIKFEELEDVSEQAVMAGNAVEVAGLRLKADNIKWMLGKMAPKRYGDKTQTEVTGAVNLTLFDGEQARRMAEQLTRDSSRA